MNRTCVHKGCGLELITERDWRKLTKAERAERKAAGYAQHRGRNLCNLHYQRARRSDSLEAYRLAGRTDYAHRRAATLEDWEYLYDPSLTILENCRLLAPRLGYTDPRSLERMLARAGVKSRFGPGGYSLRTAA